MRVTIWGCRGSVATPGPETVEFGGNTSCVEVSLDDGTVLVLDAGTGIRELGFDLVTRGARKLHLLLTHLHLDHLEGLRFFAPLFNKDVALEIWGPRSPVLSLEGRIRRSFSPPLFPIDLRDLPAQVTFRDVPWEPWTLDGATVTARLVIHPGLTVGYRVETADPPSRTCPTTSRRLQESSTSRPTGSPARLDRRAGRLARARRAVLRGGVRAEGRLGPHERRGRRGVRPYGGCPAPRPLSSRAAPFG